MINPEYDAIIIGAGFFGLEIALELHRMGFQRIVVVERENRIMRRASYVNQARVHNGYHYPRSLATAERSRVNFAAFVVDYADAVMNDMESVYAIARGSRVSASQFETFCRMVGAPCQPAPRRISDLFDGTLIEAAFVTREIAFDSSRLSRHLRAALHTADIELLLQAEAQIVGGDDDGVDVKISKRIYRASYVFNCTYADIEYAGVSLRTGVKKELTEMLLIEPPPELQNLGVTVMDGPFFSTMPFPAAGLHSLSHVRYTPHESYVDSRQHNMTPQHSNQQAIIRDSQRYLPCLSRARIMGSLFDVKATLLRNEDDDGRPILIERATILPRVLSVLGAKIDNIYDVRQFLRAEKWNIAA